MEQTPSNFDFFEEPKHSDVKVSELNQMVEKLFALRAEVDAMEVQVSLKNGELEILKNKVTSILQDQHITNFPSEFGAVTVREKFQVSMPKDPEKAAKLRAYLVENGLGDDLTVNYNRLNSIYTSAIDEMERQGLTPDLDNLIPGLEKPSVRVTLAMRKGK